LEFADHRHVSLESGRGADVYLRALQALLDVAEVSASRVDDVLALRPDAALVRYMHFGTARDGGGAFERQSLILWIFGPDGLLTRLEFFESDDDDRALARFDELTGSGTTGQAIELRRRTVRPNAATATTAQIGAAIAARDEKTLAGLFSEAFGVVDHINGVSHDLQGTLAAWHSLMGVPSLTAREEPVATLGDVLAVVRLSLSADGVTRGKFDVGPYEAEQIRLVENDAHGRRRRGEYFHCHRLGDAVARLYARYAEELPDGIARTRAAATARSIAPWVGPLDLERVANAIAPDLAFVDHVTLGMGSVHGADAFMRGARSLVDASRDSAFRL